MAFLNYFTAIFLGDGISSTYSCAEKKVAQKKAPQAGGMLLILIFDPVDPSDSSNPSGPF